MIKENGSSKERQTPLRWTQGMSEQQKVRFTEALRHDTLVLGRLKEILLEELNALDRKETNPSIYDSPSWGNKQAHYNGVRNALNLMVDLIPF